MLHLDTDRLAELASATPSSEESAHLAVCGACAREVAAQRALLGLARASARPLAEPLSDWSTLSDRLHAEGLAGESGAPGGSWIRRVPRPWLQIAAAIVLVAGGIVVGRWSVRAASAPLEDVQNVAELSPSRGVIVTPASDSMRLVTVQDALAVMEKAESDYRTAAAFIIAHDSADGTGAAPGRYRTRLAALDKMSDAALQAVNQAPYDPVLNQYYISMRGARQATLQQLNSTLPAGTRLVSW